MYAGQLGTALPSAGQRFGSMGAANVPVLFNDEPEVVALAAGLFRTCGLFRISNATGVDQTSVRCFGHGVPSHAPSSPSLLGVGGATGGTGAPRSHSLSTAPIFSKNGGAWGARTPFGVKIDTTEGRRLFAAMKVQPDNTATLEGTAPVHSELPAVDGSTGREDTSGTTPLIFLSDLIQEFPINVHEFPGSVTPH